MASTERANRTVTGPEQVRAWRLRHGLDKLSAITAVDVLAARDRDFDEALEEEIGRRIDAAAAERLLARRILAREGKCIACESDDLNEEPYGMRCLACGAVHALAVYDS